MIDTGKSRRNTPQTLRSSSPALAAPEVATNSRGLNESDVVGLLFFGQRTNQTNDIDFVERIVFVQCQ
jgi:hypothetical protein